MRLCTTTRWRHFMVFGWFRRRPIFVLLLLNLVFFVAVYLVASSGKDALESIVHERTTRISRFVTDNLGGDPVNYANKGAAGVTNRLQKECSDLKQPDIRLTESFEWYQVSSKTFVYSAYFDNRTSEERVVVWGISTGNDGAGLTPKRTSMQYCQVWYAGKQLPVILLAKHYIVPETHGTRYAPAMFICAVIRHDPPYAVSLVTNKCDHPTHVLPVHHPSRHKSRYRFTVCVSPLNKHYDDIYALTEMVEINRILGADKIVFYNHTTGHRLNQYLDYYINNRIVDVIPWKIPVTVEPDEPDPRISPDIHYFGQVVALNECLYRYMYESKYIVFTDLDEVIVPRQHKNWLDLFKHLHDSDKHLSGRSKNVALMFRNVFFRIDWPDEGPKATIDTKLRLRTQLKLKRENYTWPLYERTKYILEPRAIIQVGIHYVFSFVPRRHFEHISVPTDLALLHHYREWGDDGDSLGIVDNRMLDFRPYLHQSVIDVHRNVGLLNLDF